MAFNPIDAAKGFLPEIPGIGQEKSSTALTGYYDPRNKLFGSITVPGDWYKIYPYQFVVVDARNDKERKNGTRYIYSLPLPPDSLSINMIPASSATATLGGVVEETSVSVFWQVQLTGTTGIAVGRPTSSEGYDTKNPASIFRSTISTTGLLSSFGSALTSLANPLINLENLGRDFASGNINPLQAGAGQLGILTQPNLPYTQSAVSNKSNGYKEIQLLHRFLFSYTALKDKEPDSWHLYFINHKDDQKMRVILQGGLQITKSAQEPNLYRYRISMKGWDNRSIQDFVTATNIDRYKGDLKPVNTMTITGMASSAGSLMGTIMGGPKSIAGALNLVPSVI